MALLRSGVGVARAAAAAATRARFSSSAATHRAQPPVPEWVSTALRPEWHDSAVVAAIPRGTHVVARPGSLVASSSQVEKTSSLHGGLLAAIRRRINGGFMFLDVLRVRSGEAGAAVVAPEGFATVMELPRGHRGLLVRADAFLACTPEVAIARRSRHGVVSADALQLDGAGGTVAITGAGHAVVVELAEGETFVVRRPYLLAWDGTVTTQVQDDPDDSNDARFLPQIRSRARSVLRRLVGADDRVSLTGPGKLCFTTTVRPKLANFKKAVENTIIVRNDAGGVVGPGDLGDGGTPIERRAPKPPRIAP